jgi:hypothetical protein
MNNKVLYFHIRNDSNEVFYIGIGKPSRPYSLRNRNKYWKNIVAKHGHAVHVIRKDLSWDEACQLEIYYIKTLRKLGNNLCNITSGGEGASGCIPNAETRKKISKKNKGRKYSLGRGLTPEHKAKISTAKKGRIAANRKPFLCHENGVVYPSLRHAAKELGVFPQNISKVLNGKYKQIRGFSFSYHQPQAEILPTIKEHNS